MVVLITEQLSWLTEGCSGWMTAGRVSRTGVGVLITSPPLAAKASAMSTSGWVFALWATTESFFSNFFPQMEQENW